jgi:hypothetical protein
VRRQLHGLGNAVFHGNANPGDETRFVAGQEQARRCHVPRVARDAERRDLPACFATRYLAVTQAWVSEVEQGKDFCPFPIYFRIAQPFERGGALTPYRTSFRRHREYP